jgi:hypothetical protein
MNPKPKSVLLIEFNELTATLLERFMDEGILPAFKSFFESSAIYTTTAGDDPLEPWIQWPTVHCGVPYGEHRALHLGDGAEIRQKAIGTVLSENGVSVGIMGMMNGNYSRPRGYYVPDPWNQRDAVHPQELVPFFEFVAEAVRENTRGISLDPRRLIGFVAFMLAHGLSVTTVVETIRQLAGERFRPGVAWRRVAILDLLQYDLFRYLNRRHRVRFASLFSNSTAHLQHYFWRDMDPAGFDEPPSKTADRSLRDAIRFGYRSMDRLLGRIVRDHPGFRLILCTGLSQRPWLETTKCTYRPNDFSEFLRFAGISEQARVLPVMAERFRIEFDSEEEAEATVRALAGLTCRGAPLMRSEVTGATVHTGCAIYDPKAELLAELVTSGDRTTTFGALLYRITAMNSGRHDRHGSLWIRDGAHRTIAEPIPLTAIAPTVLAYFGIESPPTMRGAAIGPMLAGARELRSGFPGRALEEVT